VQPQVPDRQQQQQLQEQEQSWRQLQQQEAAWPAAPALFDRQAMLLLAQAVQRPHLAGELLQALAPLAGGSIQDRLLLGLVVPDLQRGLSSLLCLGRVQWAETQPGNVMPPPVQQVAPLLLSVDQAQRLVIEVRAAARHAARMCLQEGWWQLHRAEREFQEAVAQLAATAAAQGCGSAAADHRDASSQSKKSKQCSIGICCRVKENAVEQQMAQAVGALVQARDAWQELQELLASCGRLRLRVAV
jgi:hypothetical protein